LDHTSPLSLKDRFLEDRLESRRRRRPDHRCGELSQGATSYAALLASSLSVPAAAVRLGIDPETVRRRPASRRLYGIRLGETWQLPAFQFVQGGGEIPGLSRVLPALPAGLHPMAVWRWLSTPLPELATEDGPWSPLAWLVAGGNPGPVVALTALL
jgi:hypothetical protein